MNPYINLINCEKGGLLILKDGSLAKYVSYQEDAYFPHTIELYKENVGRGSRCNDGGVFKNNKMDEDLDVVLVFPKQMNTREFRYKLSSNRNERSR